MDPRIVSLIGVVILLAGSAFFSASETAFSLLNSIRVKQMQKSPKYSKAAKRVLYIYKRYEKFLNTVLVFNNIANTVLTVLFGILMATMTIDVFISTVITTVTIIIIGEIVPKNFARHVPETFALFASPVIIVFMFIATPITYIIKGLNVFMSRMFKEEEKVTATEKELLTIVNTIEKEGVLEQDESELIKSAIVFDEKSVLEVMKKKENTVVFYDDTEMSVAIEKIRECGYSRFPVLSRKDNSVLGILYQKDIMNVLLNKKDIPITDLLSPTIFISYRRLLPHALEKLQRGRIHIAVVVDNLVDKEYLGIITLEDILEELVGEIYDETDSLPKGVIQYGRHIYEVDGQVKVEDLFDYLKDVDNPRTEKDIASWTEFLIRKNKLKLAKGTVVNYDNLEIKVLEITKVQGKNKVTKVEIDEQTRI